ncbi:type II secretion system F family protein [bacterium]|nr:type II secretion system F family protein [bacterium]
MNNYKWYGINRYGKPSQGIISAHNLHDAKCDLRKLDIIARKITKKRTFVLNWPAKKIQTADITLFSRQLTTLITTGITLIQSLTIIHQSQKNQHMQALLSAIILDLEAGLTLSEALKKHPSQFQALFCNLIAIGEESGTLDKMMNKIATHNEQMMAIIQKVKQALMYPLVLLIIAGIVTTGLLIGVVPQFEALFSNFNATLPAPTRAIIYLSTWLTSYGYLLISLFISLLYGVYSGRKHSPTVIHFVDQLMLKLPIIGHMLQHAILARFSSTLAITFAAGLPLVEALKSVAKITGNSLYAHATLQLSHDISNGSSMQMALQKTNLFPNLVIAMITIGEESGTLDCMLEKIADYYKDRLTQSINTLNHLLEPLIMALLGLVMGGLIIAMYLPLLKMGSIL